MLLIMLTVVNNMNDDYDDYDNDVIICGDIYGYH